MKKGKQQDTLDHLKSQPYFQRYNAHVNSVTHQWLPGITKLYEELQNRYFPTANKDKATILQERAAVDILEDSPYMGFSINIGPQAVAAIHRDSSNMLGGPCAIGVFGTFDGHKGGHLVLHEAKVIIEVIPGDVIIILSSTITHENIPLFTKKKKEEEGVEKGEVKEKKKEEEDEVEEGEVKEEVKEKKKEDELEEGEVKEEEKTRHSFVHYTAGGLFQWLWDGKKLHKDVTEPLIPGEGKKRFAELYSLLPNIQDLKKAGEIGYLPDHDIIGRIQRGQSLLMREDVV